MPKKHIYKKRKMSGGFWPFSSNQSSASGTNSSSSDKKSWFNFFGTSSTPSPSSTYSSPTTSTTYSSTTSPSTQNYPSSTSTYNSSYGGKSRKHKKLLKGGYHDNSPTTGLAVNAAPFSGPTARAHNWVGGKTRRHRRTRKHHRHNKSCRHRN